jgi:hypothetical protein
MGGRLRFPNPLHACSFQAPKAKPHRGSVEPAGFWRSVQTRSFRAHENLATRKRRCQLDLRL